MRQVSHHNLGNAEMPGIGANVEADILFKIDLGVEPASVHNTFTCSDFVVILCCSNLWLHILYLFSFVRRHGFDHSGSDSHC